MNGVSCAAVGSCVAVGAYNDSNGADYGLIDSLSSGSWAGSAATEPSTNGYGLAPATVSNASLSSISCPSATWCVAVGSYQDTPGYSWGMSETLSGGSWSDAAALAPSTNGAGYGLGDENVSNSVSCAAVASCAAVGWYTDADGAEWGFVDALSGGIWSATAAAEPSGAASEANSGDTHVPAVSCAADGFCALAGTYLNSSSDQLGVDPRLPRHLGIASSSTATTSSAVVAPTGIAYATVTVTLADGSGESIRQCLGVAFWRRGFVDVDFARCRDDERERTGDVLGLGHCRRERDLHRK